MNGWDARPRHFAIDPGRLTVSVPTPVIWGEKDTPLLVQNLEGLDQFVPRLAIKRIPDEPLGGARKAD